MNIVRKYKISKLLNQALSDNEQGIIDFINDWIKDLIIFTSDDLPNVNHYMKADGTYVFEHYTNTNDVYVREDGFAFLLRGSYELGFTNTQNILKHLIQEIYSIKIDYMAFRENHNMIETNYMVSLLNKLTEKLEQENEKYEKYTKSISEDEIQYKK